MRERVTLEWREHIGPVLTLKLFHRKFGFCFCHRKKERCFKIKDYTFPICSRCTGLIVGIVFTMIYLYAAPFPSSPLSIFLTFPLLIDGFTQQFLNRESNNMLRFLTGLLFSFAVIAFLEVIV